MKIKSFTGKEPRIYIRNVTDKRINDKGRDGGRENRGREYKERVREIARGGGEGADEGGGGGGGKEGEKEIEVILPIYNGDNKVFPEVIEREEESIESK